LSGVLVLGGKIMNIKCIIVSSVIAVFTLTLAGCNSNPGVFIEKRIKRAYLLNEINAPADVKDANNAEIKNVVDGNFQAQVKSAMKRDCSRQEIDKLGKYETCYVDKLQEIHNKNDHAALSTAESKCYQAGFKAKLKGTCAAAIAPLESKLNALTRLTK